MMKIARKAIKIILMFSLVLCFGIALGYANNINGETKLINFYFENRTVTKDLIKSIEEQDKELLVTGWREETQQSAQNLEFNRSVNDLKVLLINGSSSLLVKGPLLFKDDINGCLIDSETSYKLFGSKYSVGKEIIYNNRVLTVREIHSGTKANIIVQLLDDSQDALTGLSIDGTSFTRNKVEEFKTKYGITEMDINGGIYSGFAKFIVLIFPITALALLLIKVILYMMKSRRKPILVLIYTIVAVALIFIFFKVTGARISIPLDMIPNKWSDFDFWSRLGKEYSEKLEYVLYMKKYGIDIYNIENLLKSALYSIYTIILFIINLKVIKIKSIKQVIISTIVLIISSFITVLIVWSKYTFDVNITMLWLIYPLYICGDYFIKTHEKYLIYEEVYEEKKEELKTEIEDAFC